MTIDYQKLRLDGVYRQNEAGQLMLRVKAPAGVLSAVQAQMLCELSETFSNGLLHLTCRGSVELHWLEYPQLAEILRRLAAVGLTSRGACGGAVRGISCSTPHGPGFGVAQRVARQLHRHFAGNPHFEGLPKKFKIGVETGYAGARHLIQDLGIVHTGSSDTGERFDVWCAGGLGREPQAAFRLAQAVAEADLLPLAEAVVRVYARHAPPGKRLKHVVRAVGEARLRALITSLHAPPLQPPHSLAGALTTDTGFTLAIPVFAGEITAPHCATSPQPRRSTATACWRSPPTRTWPSSSPTRRPWRKPTATSPRLACSPPLPSRPSPAASAPATTSAAWGSPPPARSPGSLWQPSARPAGP
jgi:sulfite reductase (ferredoxin)